MKLTVPTWIALAPTARNSSASRPFMIPPEPMTGTPTARAHSWQRASASGLMEGPESPPVVRFSLGLSGSRSMAMPTKVLTAVTASAPPCSHAIARSPTEVTSGESLAISAVRVSGRRRRIVFSSRRGTAQ